MPITKNCTGCSACVNACPKKCITLKPNAYGELTPVIGKECIKCGKCKNVCPQNNEIKTNYPINCFVAWNKDASLRSLSTSGAVSTTLGINFVKKGGTVYGCYYDEELNLKHYRATTIEEVNKFRGSKYSQSYIGNILEKVKEDLLNKKDVLFVGTPCQVSGLLSYLGKDYDTLLTVDLVCHGTPPNTYLKEHIQDVLNNQNLKVNNINFREKNDYYLKLSNSNTILYKNKWTKDNYLYAFMNNLTQKEACFNCKYASPLRVSDITIGDFWGIGTIEEFNKSKIKTSLILINNKAKQDLFNKYKDGLYLETRPIIEAIIGNGQLQYHTKKDIYTNDFKKLYKENGFTYAFNNCGIKNRMLLDNMPKPISKTVRIIKSKLKGK